MKKKDKIFYTLLETDAAILKFLKTEVAKHASLSRLSSQGKNFPLKKVHRCSSVTICTRSEERFHTEEDERTTSSSIKNTPAKDIGINKTIEAVFKKLIRDYSNTT